jgi:hypothetical protein
MHTTQSCWETLVSTGISVGLTKTVHILVSTVISVGLTKTVHILVSTVIYEGLTKTVHILVSTVIYVGLTKTVHILVSTVIYVGLTKSVHIYNGYLVISLPRIPCTRYIYVYIYSSGQPYMYGVYTVSMAGKSPFMRSYMVPASTSYKATCYL